MVTIFQNLYNPTYPNSASIFILYPFRSGQTDSVEILDTGSNSWRPGPKIPQPFHEAPLVQHPKGGVIYIINNSIYYLANAGSTAQWQLLPQKLTIPRRWFLAFFVPDDVITCN